MATFQYKAHHADQTPVEGHIDADDLMSARLSLEDQGLTVSSLHEVDVAQAKTVTPPATPTPAQSADAEQLALQRQITRVLAMGKPLAPALRAYAQELRPGRRSVRLQCIASQLEHGDPSQALAAGQIDEEWIPLLIAGASSGDPSQIQSGLIDEFQREGDLRGQFATAFAYPLVVFTVSLAILLFITLWITPTFQEMFADFGVDLPFATVLVLTISQPIRDFWWAILIAGLLLAAFLSYNTGLRNWIIQRIPIFGATVRLSDLARFTRYLAGLMDAEVPVADALRISGRNIGQTVLRRAANQLATELDSGNTDFLDSSPFYRNLPRTVVYALKLQANPRAAALILRELSWMYDRQTRNRLAWMPSLCEPVFIVLLGTAVGFYVIALFMPLVNLIQNLS